MEKCANRKLAQLNNVFFHFQKAMRIEEFHNCFKLLNISFLMVLKYIIISCAICLCALIIEPISSLKHSIVAISRFTRKNIYKITDIQF